MTLSLKKVIFAHVGNPTNIGKAYMLTNYTAPHPFCQTKASSMTLSKPGLTQNTNQYLKIIVLIKRDVCRTVILCNVGKMGL